MPVLGYWKGRSYALSVALPLLALAGEMALERHGIGVGRAFILFAAPVFLSAWVGGFGPGVVSTLLSCILINNFLMEPGHHLLRDLREDLLPLALFAVQGIFISWLAQGRIAALRAIEESHEERLKLLVESVRDYAIIMLEADGRVASWNTGAERINGYTSDEILGQNFSVFYAPEDVTASKPERELREAARLGSFEDEGWRVRKDGSRFWANVVVTAIRGPNGELKGYAKVTRDVTEKRLAEERFKTLLEVAPDAMIIVNEHGRIVIANTQSERLFGYRREEMLGEPIELLVPTRFRPQHPAQRQGYMQGPRTRPMGAGLELYGLRKDGSEFPVEISLSPLQTREGLWVTSAVRDISERKEAERRLKELNTKLQISNKELQDFASVASHDLQEPLRKIQAFGDRLKQRFAEQLSDEGQDYLQRMQAASVRMQNLIVDLLAYSRVTTQAQPPTRVDLNEVAREVLSDLEARTEQSGGEVNVEPLPAVEADPTQMRQLLQNLIGNALKFSKPGVPPRVRVYANHHDEGINTMPAGMVQLCVEDNGIGFEEKYLDRIFNVFQRLHGRGTYEGTGIGLALCRKIAERHGGAITAQSRPEEGARFIVTLPAAKTQEEKEYAGAGAKPNHDTHG
jgi:two-component system, LuxR family, sensor kinase FixL